MPEEKPPEFHLNLPASEELDKQSARIGIGRAILQKQAEIIAIIDPASNRDFSDLLESKHIQQAAEQLSQMQLEFAADKRSVFLSYSTKDEDFARELEADLRKEGVACFLAPL